MADVWNPKENENKPKSCDYYLMSEHNGKVLQVVKNDFNKAVKTAQFMMSKHKIKVRIVPRRGE